ncbi:hypothetical protein CYMTET_41008 [Cymbomonas tetramitiformis]|uniref:Uncharacterized protein n=1 Tax=Cymbomonas tetramitiformis TaxID=36881 RepID=A0AAE0F322_9CHLO|nr:hypothetical protein CYMTET_41008 [Cymbomonas tetramitiformis]
MDTCKTRLQVWAEWENNTSDSVLRIRADWTRDVRLVVNVRLRGLCDTHPWKQMYSTRAGVSHRTYGVDDFVGVGSCLARFEMREGSAYAQFTRACVETKRILGMLETPTLVDRETAFEEPRIVSAVLDVRHVRDDSYLVTNSAAFRGLLSSRIRTFQSPDGCDSVYVVNSERDARDDHKIVVGSFGRSLTNVHIFADIVKDSHALYIRGKEDLRITDSEGESVNDEFLCRVMSLYNRMQDVEFEEEVINICYATSVAFDEAFHRMCQLYRICLYNDMEWLRLMVTLYLLNKYRHSPLLCELYQFYHDLKEVGVNVSFEERVLNASIQKMMKSVRDIDQTLTETFVDKCTRGMQPWQTQLWKTFICDSKKRPRDGA